MRIVYPILLITSLVACNVAKKGATSFSNGDDICYVFPNPIIELFKTKIVDSSYFCLYSDSSCYELIIASGSNNYAKRTNRKVFFDGRFYPLIFDYDMYLGTITSEKELIRQYRAGEYAEISSYVTIHEGYYVRFEKYSKRIVASGYGIAQ